MLELMQYRDPSRRAGARQRSRRESVPPRPSAAAGFTLVEVVVVVLIIGLIAVVGIPNLMRLKVRAEMMDQVKMTRQAFAVSRINAIKGGQPVVMAWHSGFGGIVAWVDANGDEQQDTGERVVGEWVFRDKFDVSEGGAFNNFYHLNGSGSNPGVVFLPNGAAIVEEGETAPTGAAALVIGDLHGNQIAIQIIGGPGTILEFMYVPKNSTWDRELRHWRY